MCLVSPVSGTFAHIRNSQLHSLSAQVHEDGTTNYISAKTALLALPCLMTATSRMGLWTNVTEAELSQLASAAAQFVLLASTLKKAQLTMSSAKNAPLASLTGK